MFAATLYHAEPEVQSPKVKTFFAKDKTGGGHGRIEGLANFHFYRLRHTITGNLLSNGAAPKDVQELPEHSNVSTTINIYAHSTKEAKRNSARLLDKVVNGG